MFPSRHRAELLCTTANNGTPAAHVKATKTLFTEESLGRLKELGGDLQAHANAAIEEYFRQIHDKKHAN